MTPQQFIAQWGPGGPGYALNERQGAQAHFMDLCALPKCPRRARRSLPLMPLMSLMSLTAHSHRANCVPPQAHGGWP